jgi:cytochrome c-type protein NapC
MSKKSFIWGTLIFIGTILFVGVFSVTLEATNTTEFCTSCHTMDINLEELKKTTHYSNASGVTVGCADCHVPRSLGPKLWAKLMAAKDVYHEIMGTIDTPEKYEARRWHMANLVWDKMKASDSRECRDCHAFEHMDFERQDRASSKRHKWAIDKGRTCIECHQGIAHKLPEKPREKI